MAPTTPDPKKIKSFRTEAAFERWLAANHARETELWLKIHKKGSGAPLQEHLEPDQSRPHRPSDRGRPDATVRSASG